MEAFDAQAPQIIPRREARTRGLTTYFTGIPCGYGHLVGQWTRNGECVECGRARSRANVPKWRKRKASEDIDAYRAKRAKESRDRRKRNPDAASVRDKRSRDKRKEWFRAYMKQWRAENRKRLTQYETAYKAQWRKDNPKAARDKGRLAEHRRRAALVNAAGKPTLNDIGRLMEEQSGVCAGICGRSIRDRFDIDHKVPLSRGGTNWPSNLQLMCRNCNSQKHTRTMDEWLAATRT